MVNGRDGVELNRSDGVKWNAVEHSRGLDIMQYENMSFLPALLRECAINISSYLVLFGII